MARRQSRRSVSLNRQVYEAMVLEAARREMTLAGLVEFALSSLGVPVVIHPQQTLEQVRFTGKRRTASMEKRQARGGALSS